MENTSSEGGMYRSSCRRRSNGSSSTRASVSLSPSLISNNTHCNGSRTANKSARSSTKTGLLLSMLFLSIGIIYAAAAAEQTRQKEATAAEQLRIEEARLWREISDPMKRAVVLFERSSLRNNESDADPRTLRTIGMFDYVFDQMTKTQMDDENNADADADESTKNKEDHQTDVIYKRIDCDLYKSICERESVTVVPAWGRRFDVNAPDAVDHKSFELYNSGLESPQTLSQWLHFRIPQRVD